MKLSQVLQEQHPTVSISVSFHYFPERKGCKHKVCTQKLSFALGCVIWLAQARHLLTL